MQNVHHHIPANIQLGDKKSIASTHKIVLRKISHNYTNSLVFSEFSSPFAYSLTRP